MSARSLLPAIVALQLQPTQPWNNGVALTPPMGFVSTPIMPILSPLTNTDAVRACTLRARGRFAAWWSISRL